MTVYEGFTILMWVVGAMGILGTGGYRLLNVFNKAELYGWPVLWLNFIAGLISLGLVMFSNMLAAEQAISVFTMFLQWLALLGVLLWIAEVLMMVARTAVDNTKRYDPRERRRNA